jgi:hypothetical protein
MFLEMVMVLMIQFFVKNSTNYISIMACADVRGNSTIVMTNYHHDLVDDDNNITRKQ